MFHNNRNVPPWLVYIDAFPTLELLAKLLILEKIELSVFYDQKKSPDFGAYQKTINLVVNLKCLFTYKNLICINAKS